MAGRTLAQGSRHIAAREADSRWLDITEGGPLDLDTRVAFSSSIDDRAAYKLALPVTIRPYAESTAVASLGGNVFGYGFLILCTS